jgi:GT2 family glycosyltransferase
MSMTPTRQASVAAVIIADGTGGLEATLGAVDAQVYEMSRPLIVGDTVPTIAEALARVPDGVEYVWIIREGAIAPPDALESLVQDADRTGAAIAGSKIVGADGELRSVGLVTDVFGVPYTGLDRSERDQGQYDVVRDVAAVSGVSMLIRRDLLSGLGGIDPDLAPVPAAVDLAQRARLKGARVVVSPASEVRFRSENLAGSDWQSEASRIRAMLKTYGPLTLAWALPLDFLIGLVAVVVSLFFGRWLGFAWVRAWGWNVAKLPSTLRLRRTARANRVVGDSELFRFQRRGSVILSRLASRSMAGIRRRLPGDDTLSVESIGRDVRQPAFVIGLLAAVFVLLAAREIWSDGLPAVGYTLPFPVNGWDAMGGYAGGWNPAGFGSTDVLRPLVALAGLAQVVTLGAANIAEYIFTAGAMLAGIWGMTRLLRTWSVGAAPALIAGIVYVAGPTAQGIAGNTYLGTLVALGILPWALRVCLAPLGGGPRHGIGRVASVVAIFGILGAAAPLMLLVPVPVLALYALVRWSNPIAWRGVVLALAGTAGGGLLLSPWIWDHSFEAIARKGYAFWSVSPFLAIAGAVVVVAAVVSARGVLGLVAGWAAVLAGLGFLIARSGDLGWGSETESLGLAVAGLGVAVTVGVIAHIVSTPETARWERFAAGIGTVGVVVLLVAASVILLGGRVGLPGDRYADLLTFTRANEGEAERSRILLVGPSDLMPGDSRTFEGGSYRVVSAPLPDLGEPRLAPRGPLDDYLVERLGVIVAGDTRRAGAELAPFGIRWIVILGDSDGADADPESLAWREVFAGQLDLLPLSAGVEEAVFVSDIEPVGRALTTSATEWIRDGWRYFGEPENGSVFVADNPDPAFGPEPWSETAFANEVSAASGKVTFRPDAARRWQAIIAAVAMVILIGLGAWGRRES